MLKINKFIKNKSLLLYSILGIIFLINLFIELNNSLKNETYLIIRSIFLIISIYFIKELNTHLKKAYYFLLFVIGNLFFLNFILNLIDIYHLSCYFSENTCKVISDLFYKFKIYRFVTLSTYAFTYPITFLIIFKNSKKIFHIIDKQSLLKRIFLLLTFSIIISNFLKSFQIIYLSAVQSFQVRNEEYYDRFIFKNGGDSYYGWIKTFSKFIINNTEENSNILLPPQSVIYKMEGNIYYFRWFLYPRRLFHIENGYKSEIVKIKYIVISAGECNNGDCVWPDYNIDKNDISKIIVIDRKNQKTQIIEDEDYQPKDFQNMWGIIELK